MRAKLECAMSARDRRDHVFVPTGSMRPTLGDDVALSHIPSTTSYAKTKQAFFLQENNP
jgi:hypothetical protein